MNRIYHLALFLLVISCSKDNNAILPTLSNQNYILDFTIPLTTGEVKGTVNHTSGIITFSTVNADLDNINPSITISEKASISPAPGVPTDFNSPVTYKVMAEDGTERTYEVQVENKKLSDENNLLSFILDFNGEKLEGDIDHVAGTVTFNVAGAFLEGLTPNVVISDGAVMDPRPDQSQNFNEVVAYTIISSSGIPAMYRVIVNNRNLNNENDILSFIVTDGNTTVSATIDEDKQLIYFDFGDLDRTALSTAITISENATISPKVGNIQDFSGEPLTYTVSSESGINKEYQVFANMPRVNNIGGFSFSAVFFTGAEMSINGNFLDLDPSDTSVFLYDGENTYPLQVKTHLSIYREHTQNSSIFTIIPDDTPTNSSYRILFRKGGRDFVSEKTVDILKENAPNPVSVDKVQYRYNDILVVTGENLTDNIAIPAPNSSIYIIDPRRSEISVNAERTEMRVRLDNYQLFPSYYGRSERVTTIIFLENGRQGKSIQANFY